MQQAPTTDPLYFLPQNGEMAALIRQKDWSQTPVGPPQNWPQSLRTTIGTMLACPFPMFLWWGPGLIQFYNDAYLPILGHPGKHPLALGQPCVDCWPEIWPVIGPMLDSVRHGGQSVWRENMLMTIYRNGQMEDVYGTFSYSPVRDESGQIAGVLAVCQETTRHVTKAQEQQQQIVQSAARWKYVFEQVPVAVCIFQGPTFIIDLINEAQLEIVGRSGQNLLGKPVFEAIPEAAGQGIEALLTGVLTTGEPVHANERSVQLLRDGQPQTCYFNFVYQALRDDTDRIVGVVTVASEVTEQVLARQRVAQSEQLLNAMIQRTPVGFAVYSGTDNVVERANPAFAALLNRPTEEVLNRPLLEAAPELQGQGFDELLKTVRETGEAFIGNELPAQLVRNGRLETAYFDFVYEPLPNPDGSIYQVMAVVNDVTTQLLARQKLEASETRLRSIIASAPAAMGLFVGRDLVVELPNQAFIDIVGKGPDVAGKPLREVMPELTTENQPFLQILDDVYTSGVLFQSFGSQVKILRDGVMTDNYYNITYSPLRNAAGDVFAILDIAIDVTEQITAQAELAEQKTHLQNAIAVADLGTYTIDLVGNTATYSDTVRQWFGLPSTHEPVALIISRVHPDDLAQVQAVLGAAQQSEEHSSHDLVYRVINPAEVGEVCLRSFGKTRYQDGMARTLVGVLQNVTSQVMARQKLEASENQYRQLAEELDVRVKQRTQDLERSNLDLLQFASVASHDLKEPIRKVQTFGTLLRDRLADRLNAEEEDLFRRLVNSSARMQVLVSDVLRLSKLSDTTATAGPVDLNAVVQQIHDDLELAIRERGAELRVGTLPTVQAEPTQMHQLLLNLVSNALKFQDGQTPLIRVEPVPLTGAVVAELGLPDPNYAVVAVSDNGIGFDLKHKDRIFGMFQRLHGRSQFAGTGIGLTIVKKIVDNHRGYIDVQSQPGVGTTFRVALPTPQFSGGTAMGDGILTGKTYEHNQQ